MWSPHVGFFHRLEVRYAPFPKPFFKKTRALWYVEINRKQINLGSDRDAAFRRYHELMAQPRQEKVASDSVPALVDAFLEWVQRNRSAETYEWYRYRLERFVQRYPDLRSSDLRPFHVETWADCYDISVTTRRNYLRSVKRCLKWAKKQGYIDHNPIADLEVSSAQHRDAAIGEWDSPETASDDEADALSYSQPCLNK